jgi:hypothetical protein
MLAYMGSLVGLTLEIDKSSLYKQDFVRMRIGCKNLSEVPASAEGCLAMQEGY